MTVKNIFRLINWRVRILIVLVGAGLFGLQCTQTIALRRSSLVMPISGKSLGANAPQVTSKVAALAESDHIALLEYCLKNYQGRYNDYTCTFIKQERINGAVGKEQWIDVKFMDSPFSVAMKWTQNAPLGDRIIYVEGKHDDQMLVRPRGFLGDLVGTFLRSPDSPPVMQNTLSPVSMFGFKRNLQKLLVVYRKARSAGDLTESFGGYAEIDGRQAITLIRQLPPKRDYSNAKAIIYIDTEYLLPIVIEGYDWDGQLQRRYLYKDVKFNVALNADDFLPQANGMKPPK